MSLKIDSTRYKVTSFGNSRQGVINGLPDHLIGRWVSIVAADDDCHLAAPVQKIIYPTKEWVGLTKEDIYAIGKHLGQACRLGGNPDIDIDYARAIEDKIEELNT